MRSGATLLAMPVSSANAAKPTSRPPLLTSVVAAQLLAALDAGEPSALVSVDLGLSSRCVPLSKDEATIGQTRLPRSALADIVQQDRKCFELIEGELRPVAVFSEATGWYRSLLPTADAPTTVVAGFAMHRISGTTPMADTRAKVAALGRPRGRVLDTATGLGYTAIELAKTSREVVTVECDPAAIALARRNPWSDGLFANERVRLLTGNIAEVVAEFATAEFAAILHDPPTVALAGELYSADFYRQLHRVLKAGGRLFHYVGDSQSKAGNRTTRGVMQRLATAGFRDVRRQRRAFGVAAVAGGNRRGSQAGGGAKRAPSKSKLG